MGIHSNCSNKKTSNTQKNRNKMRRVKRQERKKLKGIVQGDIIDADIITVHHLRKRRTDPKSNITLSKKKRRKIIKQIQYSKKEKEQMQVEVQTTKTKSKKETPKAVSTDVEMKE